MIIAAVRNERDMEKALKSEVEIIFYLSPNILTIEKNVRKAHDAGKKIYLHVDLAARVSSLYFLSTVP